MKKRLTAGLILVAALVAFAPLSAQERVVERTWLSTDKDVYLAGETVWLSAFCLDAASGAFSDVSSVAYVELHSAGGLAATAKVALSGGRGGGRAAAALLCSGPAGAGPGAAPAAAAGTDAAGLCVQVA